MKTLLATTAALVLIAGSASAQVAAGTVPDPFARPTTGATTAPAAVPPAAAPTSKPAHPKSEELLRAVLANAQAGTPDYTLMTDSVATQMQGMAPRMLPLIQGLGPLLSVSFVEPIGDSDRYAVVFTGAITEWRIAVNPEGKISLLAFRPAQ